jgi:hypothetical protein
MIEPKTLEDLAAKLAGILPPGLRSLRAELEDNFKAVLRTNLGRLELVSRERFDVQAEVLARALSKLSALEKRLTTLEARSAHADTDS